MSNNKHHSDQPALWEEPTSESTPTRGRRRGRPEAAPPTQPTGPAEPQRHPVGERLWTAADVAAYLGVPVKTVYAWRSRGRGPKGFRIGKHLRWRVATVFEWSLDQERNQ
ncbi:helix-turn-helix transcriptional regulator [Pimelobacter simplex]|uniref:helix-turn-helix transcriptional regulator n=1 Tax=Nocardioides simplex TaxID=2045 RepID=UPI001931462B|nr:helix-turn-helix domain-containing protein [Pimelobacter simplex]